MYKSMTGGPGVISEACLQPGWPVELFPSGSRGRDFISQHQAVIVSVAPGKGVCSRDSHPERLCCEQTDRQTLPARGVTNSLVLVREPGHPQGSMPSSAVPHHSQPLAAETSSFRILVGLWLGETFKGKVNGII